jgi:hypothetical protein
LTEDPTEQGAALLTDPAKPIFINRSSRWAVASRLGTSRRPIGGSLPGVSGWHSAVRRLRNPATARMCRAQCLKLGLSSCSNPQFLVRLRLAQDVPRAAAWRGVLRVDIHCPEFRYRCSVCAEIGGGSRRPVAFGTFLRAKVRDEVVPPSRTSSSCSVFSASSG